MQQNIPVPQIDSLSIKLKLEKSLLSPKTMISVTILCVCQAVLWPKALAKGPLGVT